MKIILEFEHPCELIDLLEKLTQSFVLPTATCSDELVKECSDGTRIYKVEN